MTYQVKVKSGNETRVETAEGIKELRTNLALYKKQGWSIEDISRIAAPKMVTA